MSNDLGRIGNSWLVENMSLGDILHDTVVNSSHLRSGLMGMARTQKQQTVLDADELRN